MQEWIRETESIIIIALSVVVLILGEFSTKINVQGILFHCFSYCMSFDLLQGIYLHMLCDTVVS